VLLTDSEGEADGEENEYQLGSFVCDDEDMGFESESWNLYLREINTD
jgi:hypothetical protein